MRGSSTGNLLALTAQQRLKMTTRARRHSATLHQVVVAKGDSHTLLSSAAWQRLRQMLASRAKQTQRPQPNPKLRWCVAKPQARSQA